MHPPSTRRCIRLALGLTLALLGLLGSSLAGERILLRGSLHDHTGEAGDDGKGSVQDALKAAREAGFDFFALTPHNHMISEDAYTSLSRQMDAADEPGSFVALAGYEWGSLSKGGHVNVLGSSRLCKAGGREWKLLWSHLDGEEGDPLVILNHPVWARGFGGAPTEAVDRRVALIEVLGGPSHPEGTGVDPDRFHDDVLVLLNQGWRGGLAFGEDDHTARWGRVTRACMGVYAREVSREGLMEALRAGLTYASEDRRLSVWLEAGSVAMGGELPLGPVEVRVHGEREGGEVASVTLFYDPDGPGGEPASPMREVRGGELAVPLQPDTSGAYAFAVVTDRQGASCWSSPVWFGGRTRYLSPPDDGRPRRN